MALSGSVYKDFGPSSKYRLLIEWTATQDTASNTSNITARMYLQSLGSSYTISSSANKTGKMWIDGAGYTNSAMNVGLSGLQKKLLWTQTHILTHNPDGVRQCWIDGELSVNVTLSGVYYGTISLDAVLFTLDNIPRGSAITTFGDFTIGDTIPINLNRYIDSYTHDLTLMIGSTVVASRSGIGVSTIIDLTEGEEDVIYQAIPSASSVTVTLYCQTKDGQTNIGPPTAKSVIAAVGASILPTIGAVTDSELTSVVGSIVGKYVKGLSNIRIAVTGAAGVKHSTIVSYLINFNGVNYNAVTIDTGIINFYGNVTVVGKITDSRGRVAEKAITLNALDYSVPNLSTFTVKRCGSDGTLNELGVYASIIRTGSASSLINSTQRNRIQAKIYSKLRTVETWILVNTLAESADVSGAASSIPVVISGYDADKSYDFKVELIDKFNTTIALAIMSTAAVPMAWSDVGVGIGKVPEADRILDVNGDLTEVYFDGANLKSSIVNLIYPVGSIYLSVTSVSPATLFGGTWIQLQDRFLLGAGATYINSATGGAATHTLTLSEAPSHYHTPFLSYGSAATSNVNNHYKMLGAEASRGDLSAAVDDESRISATAKGGGQAHNNMPPYLVAYMWKRTA
ncbi:MAG: hypothetical protein HGA49_00380 [Eubacteriaceae bacterium]|nr:hypothetical protein [Eubacteriaceae bacterium]